MWVFIYIRYNYTQYTHTYFTYTETFILQSPNSIICLIFHGIKQIVKSVLLFLVQAREAELRGHHIHTHCYCTSSAQRVTSSNVSRRSLCCAQAACGRKTQQWTGETHVNTSFPIKWFKDWTGQPWLCLAGVCGTYSAWHQRDGSFCFGSLRLVVRWKRGGNVVGWGFGKRCVVFVIKISCGETNNIFLYRDSLL